MYEDKKGKHKRKTRSSLVNFPVFQISNSEAVYLEQKQYENKSADFRATKLRLKFYSATYELNGQKQIT